MPRDPLPLSPSSSPQARPEHLRSARGLSMEPGPLYRLTHQVLLHSKARDVPQEGFTSPRQHSELWRRTKSPTIKGTSSMKYLMSSNKTQQKDLPLTNRKEVWSYWVRTCGLQGSQWKALEGLDSYPHNRPHHHAYQCHYELTVWKLTNGTFLVFFKSTKSGCADPIHSDLLEQEERTPGQSRWSILSVLLWIGACVGDTGLMKSRV